ncbi:MAG: DNA repair protein RecO [Candidatus Rokubacteria bacterium]|nr:DNA repair protein RecO [Candidatus Rokubacteria bacterium]
MAVERTAAVVIGGFPLGESDRVVTFFTRRFGKVRGVAKAARRMRSKFSGALELFTLGELVFFDGGRSELVQVDHFDIERPFGGIRADLGRLGHAAWMAESVARLTAERDPHPAMFALLSLALAAVDGGASPSRVAVVFGARFVDALGHRLRTDACVLCGRGGVIAGGRAAVDVDAGGTVCPSCAGAVGGTLSVAAATIDALRRVRTARWGDVMALPLGTAERELRAILEAHVTRLAGQGSRAARFLREVSRSLPVSEAP